MSFYLDFKKIDINMFYEYLRTRRLFETHSILKNDIEGYKQRLYKLGYNEIDTLYKDIKTQKRVDAFAENNNIDNQYVTVLRRHLMSLVAKPRKITDFVRMQPETISYLLSKEINTTKDLYENIDAIHTDEMDYLFAITDLCRLRYLHVTFLDGIYFSGYKSIDDLAHADIEELSNKINKTMIQYNLSKAKLGLKDAEYLIEDAKLYKEWLNL